MQEEMFQLLNFKSKAYDWMLKSNLANFQKYQILIFTYKCRNRFNKNASLSNEESEETKCGLIYGQRIHFQTHKMKFEFSWVVLWVLKGTLEKSMISGEEKLLTSTKCNYYLDSLRYS